MEFGRPTILVVPQNGESLLITPSMELDMASAAAVVDKIEAWDDGLENEWREALPSVAKGNGQVAIEPNQMPPLVRRYIGSLVDQSLCSDITPIVSNMRMIKCDEELQLARHAGEVAKALMLAARNAIADGVPEFEVALATTAAVTLPNY